MDPQRLAQMLLARELIPSVNLEQALQRQVVAGGSLDTNLLEMELTTEPELLAALGQALGMPTIDRSAIDATGSKLTEAFPLVFAETYHLVPHRLQDSTLHVLVQGPLDEKLASRIQARFNLHLAPCITCEVRLHYAMHRLYGLALLPRYVTLLQKLDGPSASLTADSVGASLSEHRLGWGVSNARVSPLRSRAGRPLSGHDVRSQVARLDAAPDRDSVVDILLSFAIALFDFVGLFLVHGQRLQGWRSTDPTRTQQLAQFDLDLNLPSVFQTVVQTHGHYLGPIAAHPGNRQLFELLDRPTPHAALVAPVMVGGKLAAILYADHAERSIGPKKVAALLVLVQRSGLCLEYLIRRRKVMASTATPQGENEPAPATTRTPTVADANANANADADANAEAEAKFVVQESDTYAMAEGSEEARQAAYAALPDNDRLAPALMRQDEPSQGEDEALQETFEAGSVGYDQAPARSDAYSIGWDDVIAEAARAAALTPQRFAAVQIMQTPVERRDLLFDGLETDDPAARQSAVSGLLAMGSSIDAELTKRFPGTFSVDPLQILSRDLPPFARLNGLTELIAARGTEAAALVLPHLDSDIPRHRWTAVYFLSSVHYPAACEALARRLYDTEPRIRSLAVDALVHYRAEAAYQRIISGLREQLRVPVVETQVAAIQILGQLREPSAVPALIPLVVTQNLMVARSAASALAVVCGQAYGSDLNQWQAWWQSNYTRPRTQWLIGGLSHANSTIRRVAHGELQRLTGQVVPFKPDASVEEQARLLQAWQTSLLPND